MNAEMGRIFTHLAVSLIAGGAIGLERSYHGRPAGFRTHSLVCMASSLLMLVTIYQRYWYPEAGIETIRVDPTRMAQGVMTGIGFLGAGVIMKEGLSVRGLTTAASIWITAAIGILAGVGLYGAVALGTVLTLGVLSFFRWIETRIPILSYYRHTVRFHLEKGLEEKDLIALINSAGFTGDKLSCSIVKESGYLEYSMTIRTLNRANMTRLTNVLSGLDSVIEFQICPVGD